jgi:proline-specific peptidase
MRTTDGYIDFKGYKTYYVIHGDMRSGETPLVILHGGPGYTHYYLDNLSRLAEGGRPVILYDQLGCGKSDRPYDPKLWTINLFVEELATIREALGLNQISLLGQSWGGTLALEYLFRKPEGVEKLILSSPLLDTKIWVDEARRLIEELPAWAAKIMREHEAKGTTDSYEYKQAYAEFKKRHICRIEPYPKEMVKSDNGAGDQVYNAMWGPNETQVKGVLKNWTSLDKIHEIDIPTLFISGKYDEATPKQIDVAHKLLPGSEWVLLDKSSHMANLEEPDKYLEVVEKFLDSTPTR